MVAGRARCREGPLLLAGRARCGKTVPGRAKLLCQPVEKSSSNKAPASARREPQPSREHEKAELPGRARCLGGPVVWEGEAPAAGVAASGGDSTPRFGSAKASPSAPQWNASSQGVTKFDSRTSWQKYFYPLIFLPLLLPASAGWPWRGVTWPHERAGEEGSSRPRPESEPSYLRM